MKRLAVLISNSGTGTNLQAIIDAIENEKLDAKIAVVISDRENAYGLVRAKKHNIPALVINKKNQQLEDILFNSSLSEFRLSGRIEGFNKTEKSSTSSDRKAYTVDYVLMAGWKSIIPDSFIALFPNKILNIHPGLIPDTLNSFVINPDKTKGLWNRGKFTDKAIQEFLNSKATYAGSSVHFLSHEFDFGKVLARDWEKIKKDDTVDSLYKRLKKKENKMLVDVLKNL